MCVLYCIVSDTTPIRDATKRALDHDNVRMAWSVDFFRVIGIALMIARYAKHLRPASFPPRCA